MGVEVFSQDGDAVGLRHVHGKAVLHGARGAFAFVAVVVITPHQFEQYTFAQCFLADDSAVEVKVLVERGEDADAAREAVGARFVHAQFFRQFVGVADVGEFVEQGVEVGAVDGVFFEDAGDGFGGAAAEDDALPRFAVKVGADVWLDDGTGVVAGFLPLGKWRLAMLAQPMVSERRVCGVLPSPRMISVEPPPMSMTRLRSVKWLCLLMPR